MLSTSFLAPDFEPFAIPLEPTCVDTENHSMADCFLGALPYDIFSPHLPLEQQRVADMTDSVSDENTCLVDICMNDQSEYGFPLIREELTSKTTDETVQLAKEKKREEEEEESSKKKERGQQHKRANFIFGLPATTTRTTEKCVAPPLSPASSLESPASPTGENNVTPLASLATAAAAAATTTPSPAKRKSTPAKSRSSSAAASSSSSASSSAASSTPSGKSERKTHVCSTCGYSCKRKSDLDKHQRIHTGQKPYACDQCDKRFTQKSHLVVHTRKHSDERPFVCDATLSGCRCGKSFKCSLSLRKHVARFATYQVHPELFNKVGSTVRVKRGAAKELQELSSQPRKVQRLRH